MATELQALIDTIQTEAVAKAETEAAAKPDTAAAETTAAAKKKAAGLVQQAEADAKAKLAAADQEAQAFAERSRRTLEQAARDLILTVGQGVTEMVERLIKDAVDQTLQPELIGEMLLKMAATTNQDQPLEVVVPEKDRAALETIVRERLAEAFKGGVTLTVDNELFSGFRVVVADAHVEHDFTGPAVAAALAQFVRPHLAEIVRAAAQHAAQPPTEK
ncbi:MAG: ATPase [Candidatus Marinimicrobia bacterium]|nr:ATPase [Candidatus Neomarinimicrobiota bacterium]